MSTPINYRGKYDPDEDYHALDVVYSGPNNVICVRANSGQQLDDPHYWAVISKGESGAAPAVTINPTTKHWIVNGKDTGAVSQGETGSDTQTLLLSANQDLNSLKSSNTYIGLQKSVANSPFSNPTAVQFVLEVKGYGNTYAIQRATDLGSDEQWERTCNGSTWTRWRQITKWS